jgi:hypothetical protein
MSKNKNKNVETLTQDEFESALKSEELSLDGTALSVVRKSNSEFLIVKVPFDSVNLKGTGELEIVDTAGDRAEATEKFKILVVRNGII